MNMKKTGLIIKISLILLFVSVSSFFCDFFFLKTFHPFISNYICNIVTDCIGIIVTLCFIQNIFDNYDTNKEKQEELKKILRYDEIISIYIDNYIRYFYCITTPLDKRFKEINSSLHDFKLQDLCDLYSFSAMVTAPLFQPAIEIFYKWEQELRKTFMNTIRNIDFKYYPEIGNLLVDYINNSLTKDVSDAIISYKNVNNGIKNFQKMIKSDYIESHYLKFKENSLGANLATPYFILFDLLHIELTIINQYKNEIEKIKAQNK